MSDKINISQLNVLYFFFIDENVSVEISQTEQMHSEEADTENFSGKVISGYCAV